MSTAHADRGTTQGPTSRGVVCPFDLRVTEIGRFLNCELTDDPVYDGLELQFYDDAVHGTGMLAFLSRRADRTVDYYYEPGLEVDRDSLIIGGGTGAWTATSFEASRLVIDDDGVQADVRFTDLDGTLIEVHIDDRDGRDNDRGVLLAPVSDGIEHPNSLLLVLLSEFDLVRDTGTAPVIRIGGRDAATGQLPGARLHKRLLVKYASPLCSAELNRNHEGPLLLVDPSEPGPVELTPDGRAVAALTARQGDHHARMALDPPMPDLALLPDGAALTGTWTTEVDGHELTGGTWSARRNDDTVALVLDVRDRWRPGPLPWLIRAVTTIVPIFTRWPTTYRWTATVSLGPEPAMTSHWERTDSDLSDGYRRATTPRGAH